MPFFLIIFGLALVITAARGKEQELTAILASDFTSKNNFIGWLVAFAFIGFLGSTSKKVQPFTDAFSALLLVVLLVGQRGFFEQFERQALR